jgi:hypothetical protein
MLRSHRELLLNWFRAKKQISGGIVEGFNNGCSGFCVGEFRSADGLEP